MPVRHEIKGKDGKFQSVALTPLSAIRAFCLECVCWQPSEVSKCTAIHCPLYHYRHGHDPSRRGIGNTKKRDSE